MVAIRLRVIDFQQEVVRTEVRLFVQGRAQFERVPFQNAEYLLNVPVDVPCSLEVLAPPHSHCFPVSQHLSTDGRTIRWNDTGPFRGDESRLVTPPAPFPALPAEYLPQRTLPPTQSIAVSSGTLGGVLIIEARLLAFKLADHYRSRRTGQLLHDVSGENGYAFFQGLVQAHEEPPSNPRSLSPGDLLPSLSPWFPAVLPPPASTAVCPQVLPQDLSRSLASQLASAQREIARLVSRRSLAIAHNASQLEVEVITSELTAVVTRTRTLMQQAAVSVGRTAEAAAQYASQRETSSSAPVMLFAAPNLLANELNTISTHLPPTLAGALANSGTAISPSSPNGRFVLLEAPTQWIGEDNQQSRIPTPRLVMVWIPESLLRSLSEQPETAYFDSNAYTSMPESYPVGYLPQNIFLHPSAGRPIAHAAYPESSFYLNLAHRYMLWGDINTSVTGSARSGWPYHPIESKALVYQHIMGMADSSDPLRHRRATALVFPLLPSADVVLSDARRLAQLASDVAFNVSRSLTSVAPNGRASIQIQRPQRHCGGVALSGFSLSLDSVSSLLESSAIHGRSSSYLRHFFLSSLREVYLFSPFVGFTGRLSAQHERSLRAVVRWYLQSNSLPHPTRSLRVYCDTEHCYEYFLRELSMVPARPTALLPSQPVQLRGGAAGIPPTGEFKRADGHETYVRLWEVDPNWHVNVLPGRPSLPVSQATLLYVDPRFWRRTFSLGLGPRLVPADRITHRQQDFVHQQTPAIFLSHAIRWSRLA